MSNTDFKGNPMGKQTASNGNQDRKNDFQTKKPLHVRDLWEFILKLFIAILIIISWIMYYRMHDKVGPAAWVIFILLIILIIWLIWRQRHFIRIKCKLTKPNGCIQGYTDILPGRILEPVVGSAYGAGFGYYTLEVRDSASNLLSSNVVIYANSGGIPDSTLVHGTFPKINATLGWIDVDKAAQEAGIILLTSTTFSVTLRAYGVDEIEHCTSGISFSLEANEVFINTVGGATSNDFTNPNEPLKWGVGGDLATVGGCITVRGAANIFGCALEQIAEYTVWIIKDDNFSFAQPATNTNVFPGAGWTMVNNIKYNGSTGFPINDEIFFNRLDGNPVPSILTNTWGTRKKCNVFHIDNTWKMFCFKIPSLEPFCFDTATLPKLNPLHEQGTGKFTVLLQVIDTSGNKYYDIQRVWIDNEPIHAKITGIAGLMPCMDLFTKDASGKFKTVDINGTAWDQLIDLADSTMPTSDNFGGYSVYFNKQSASSGFQSLKSSVTPVPARPNPIGVGILSDWFLKTLDKATNPDGRPADQLLDPGEGCMYDIILSVTDKTVVHEVSAWHHSIGNITFPIKIINAAP